MKLRTNNNGLESLKGAKDLKAAYVNRVDVALKNNTIAKKDFTSIVEPIKLMDKVDDPFAVMGLSFVAESAVGLTTAKLMRIVTAKPESLLKVIEKAFPHIGENAVSGRGYNTIFRLGVNKHLMILADDTCYETEVDYVSNKEFSIFDKYIKMIDVENMIAEDVKKIQDDLWHLFRAWQESSIDFTKDKRKCFIYAMDDIIGGVCTLADLNSDAFVDNSRKIMKQIESEIIKEDKKGEIDKYEITISDPTGKLKEDRVVETTMSEYRNEIGHEIENFINDVAIPHLRNCNIKRWMEIADEFKKGTQAEMRLAYMAYKAVNVLSETRTDKMLPSYYKIVRDGLFTWADALEIPEENVPGICIMGILYKVSYNSKTDTYSIYKNEVRDNVKLSLLEKIFGDMLTAKYLEDEDSCRTMMYDIKPSELRYVYRDICSDDVYNVENGVAYDNETGDICFELKDLDYSGQIFTVGNRLLKTVDVFETANIRKDIIMLLTDKNKIKTDKWEDTENNINTRTVDELSNGGNFCIMLSKNNKVMLVKDNKDILATIHPVTEPGIEKKEDLDNLFFIGADSSEPWVLDDGKEINKSGSILVFDVDANEYFDDDDLEFIKTKMNIEDEQELKGKKIK